MDRIEIHFNEVAHSKPIRRLIHANLKEWKKHLPGDRTGNAKVEFFKAPSEKIGCYIEIKNDKSFWRSFEYGKGVQQSFLTCLKHLTENTIIERSA